VPSIHYKSSKLQSQIKQLTVESNKKQLPISQRSVQQLVIGTRRAMATNVTLINNSLVNEYLHYDANGQDVIVHSSLTHAGESDMII